MQKTIDILQKIVAHKKQEIAQRKKLVSVQQLKQQCETAAEIRDFIGAINHKINQHGNAVIAEIKKASPSKGLICADFDPKTIAESYATGGAACLSVLTDQHFFQGSDNDLIQARNACTLPVLRKEFIIDDYQIYESRALGADCILLIVAILTDERLQHFCELATELGMAVLVESHDQAELDRALKLDTSLIGINNRDLRSFSTNLETTVQLLPFIPQDRIIITESGIQSRQDIEYLQQKGVQAFLIGEGLMRSKDPGAQLQQLFS